MAVVPTVKMLVLNQCWMVVLKKRQSSKHNNCLMQHKSLLKCLIFIKVANMSLTLRTALGCTEAVLDDDGNLKRFYLIADILSDDLQVRFTRKEDDFDAINWDFSFGKHLLTLCYSIYNGVSLLPTKLNAAHKRENQAVVELANVLEGKLMNLDRKPAV